MKRLQQNALLVGLVALALGACSSTRSDMASQSTSPPPMASEPVASGTASNMPADASTQPAASSMAGGTGDMPGTAGTAGTASGAGMPDQSGYMPSPSAAAPNSIVTLIEVLPREQANIAGAPAGAGATSGSSTSGSGAGGSTAAGAGGSTAGGARDKVYRVTLHMDDGSTRVVTQEVTPNFRAGDRVRLENGMVLR